jgi:hypothetical protein
MWHPVGLGKSIPTPGRAQECERRSPVLQALFARTELSVQEATILV